jgi:hypothetical protein
MRPWHSSSALAGLPERPCGLKGIPRTHQTPGCGAQVYRTRITSTGLGAAGQCCGDRRTMEEAFRGSWGDRRNLSHQKAFARPPVLEQETTG